MGGRVEMNHSPRAKRHHHGHGEEEPPQPECPFRICQATAEFPDRVCVVGRDFAFEQRHEKDHAQRAGKDADGDQDAELGEACGSAEEQRGEAETGRECDPKNSRSAVSGGVGNGLLTCHSLRAGSDIPLIEEKAEIVSEADKNRAKPHGDHIQFVEDQRSESQGDHAGPRKNQHGSRERHEGSEGKPKEQGDKRDGNETRQRDIPLHRARDFVHVGGPSGYRNDRCSGFAAKLFNKRAHLLHEGAAICRVDARHRGDDRNDAGLSIGGDEVEIFGH